ISWGTTVKAYVDAANYINFPDLSIIPLIGGVSLSDSSLHSNHLAFTLAQKYQAHSYSFYAPVIAENKKIRDILYHSEIVKKILELGKKVDLAVIGVGNPQKSQTYRNMVYISLNEEKESNREHAIGDILTTFYDKDGKIVHTPLT